MKLKELEGELGKIYGPRAGAVFRTIMPGILADFSKMLNNAGPDAHVTEEYNLEDRKGTIVLECEKVNGVPGEISASLKTGL